MGFRTFGCSPYVTYTLTQIPTKPTTGTVEEMYCQWPQWQVAMNMAQKCMASLHMGGTHRGMGVFIKHDELLIPRHLLNNSNQFICGTNLEKLIQNISIHYNDDQYCYMPVNVLHVVEDGLDKDYCLIKIEGRLPCSVPQVTFNPHHTQCLFAEVLANGQVIVSIVSPCSMSPGLMCGSVLDWTRPGSCGGIYLDMSGQLIAIHLSQATGLCHPHTGIERKFLYAHEIKQNSPCFSALDQAYCPVPPPLCLSPVVPDPCYAPQADARTKTDKDKQGYYCESREQHLSRSERGLQIDLKQTTQDKRTKKTIDQQIASVFYQVFLVDRYGKERPNIHNSKGSPSSYTTPTAPAFYHSMSQTYQNNIYTLGTKPNRFEFTFGGYDFVAKLSNHPSQSKMLSG